MGPIIAGSHKGMQLTLQNEVVLMQPRVIG